MSKWVLVVSRFISDFRNFLFLAGVVLAIAPSISSILRWLGKINTTEAIVFGVGLVLIVLWGISSAWELAGRVVGSHLVLRTRQRDPKFNAIPMTTPSIGRGGFYLRYQRWEPIVIEHINALIELRFMRKEGGWGSGSSIRAEPMSTGDPSAASGWGFGWAADPSHASMWSLGGLPITLQGGGELNLPSIMLSVQDADEAISSFENSESAAVHIEMEVRTSLGIFNQVLDVPAVMQEPLDPTPGTEDS